MVDLIHRLMQSIYVTDSKLLAEVMDGYQSTLPNPSPKRPLIRA